MVEVARTTREVGDQASRPQWAVNSAAKRWKREGVWGSWRMRPPQEEVEWGGR